jgi:hypothetical protein
MTIICSPSKVFERILHSRLKSLSESAHKTWFNDSQHGFRVSRSTESAGSTLVNLIEGNLKKKLTTCCAFLDIKSAFDAAWQPTILNGLPEKGCPLYLIKIISSFLHSRKAELSCADTTLLTTVDLGCPQGSILSPFLWNVLVDSLLDAHFPFAYRVIAYADDLVLCAWHYDPETARRILQYSIDHAISWGAAAKLAFNAAKTVYMSFSRRKLNLLDLPPIHVNSTPIK